MYFCDIMLKTNHVKKFEIPACPMYFILMSQSPYTALTIGHISKSTSPGGDWGRFLKATPRNVFSVAKLGKKEKHSVTVQNCDNVTDISIIS